MPKKTTLTYDQATDLEEAMGDYCAGEPMGFGNPKRDIQDILHQAGVPKDVRAAIFMRLDSINEDVSHCANEVTRGNAEAVADGFRRLDEYLEKRFTVTGMPGRSKKPYRWMVSS